MWYAETDYKQIKPDNRSLVVAFANLLQTFDRNLDPLVLGRILTQDDAQIDWRTLSKHIRSVQILAISKQQDWPPTNNAIVELTRDGLPWYCLVSDYTSQLIVDSFDGMVKQVPEYGDPQGWASYKQVEGEYPAEEPLIANSPQLAPSPSKPGSTYVVEPGDTIWDIARRVNTTAEILMEHNDIRPNEVLPGVSLHLPVAGPVKPARRIRYEILPRPQEMHVKKPGGARKWSFGNADGWKDISSVGHFPENTNINIVAIAHVPLGEDTAAYYMDRFSLGDFETSGRVTYTTGFTWSDLEEGYALKVVPAHLAEQQVAAQAVIASSPKLDIMPPKPSPNSYKATYALFPGAPITHLAKDTILVQEFDTRRPDRELYRNQGVKIVGTFIKDGVLYGRPKGSAESGYWFGVPMDNLVPEDELYNTYLDLPTRVALKSKSISPLERGVVAVAWAGGQYAKMIDKFNKTNKKE